MLEKYGGLHLRASGVSSCILGLIETTISGHGSESSASIYRNYNHVEEYVPVIIFFAFISTSLFFGILIMKTAAAFLLAALATAASGGNFPEEGP
jgi:hypothetical protein